MSPKESRFELRLDEELLQQVDDWRAEQDGIPSRAEAFRRLVEAGLARSGHRSVHFSDGEKLIMLILADLLKKMKVEGDTDIDLVREIIFGGHYWAAEFEMQGIFHGHVDKRETLSYVLDVLGMWDMIELAYERLAKADKAKVDKAAHGHPPKFIGFDGNNESEQLGIARFLIEKMGRFVRFKGRDLNSHSRTELFYRPMLRTYLEMRPTLVGADALGASQIIEILIAKRSAK
jgi:uncharacterized protein YfbU (UPF0304 family)